MELSRDFNFWMSHGKILGIAAAPGLFRIVTLAVVRIVVPKPVTARTFDSHISERIVVASKAHFFHRIDLLDGRYRRSI